MVPTEDRILRAVVLLDDARHARRTRHRNDIPALKAYRIFYSSTWRHITKVVCFLHMFLASFEEPMTGKLHTDMPRVIPPILELIFLLMYARRLLYRWNFSTRESFFKHRWTSFFCVLWVLTALDTVIALIVALAGKEPLRIIRMLRPFFLIYWSKHMRNGCRDIARVVPGTLGVISVALILVSLFAMAFQIAFMGTDAGREYFPSFIDSFISLWVLTTTANFPDVMVPSLELTIWWAIGFVVFLVLTLYIVINLVLAVVYDLYRERLRTDVIKRAKSWRENGVEAFRTLDFRAQGRLDWETWKALWTMFNPKMDEQMQLFIYHVVSIPESQVNPPTSVGNLVKKVGDDSSMPLPALTKDNGVGVEEFLRAIDVLSLGLTRVEEVPPFMKTYLPKVYTSRLYTMLREWRFSVWCGKLIRSQKLEPWINVLIGINALLTILMMDEDTANANGNHPDAPTEMQGVLTVQMILTVFFILEQLIKLSVFGRQYYRDWWNIFDSVAVAGTAADMVVHTVLGMNRGVFGWLAFLSMFRALRIMRLASRLRQFKVIMGSVGQMARPLLTYWALQICLFYIFAMFGFFFFGNVIQRGDSRLMTVGFGQLGYWASSFNNVGHAMLTMFEIMVTNQWHVIVEGFATVTSKWAWLFFSIFHFISVSIIANIIVAFTLEVFMMETLSQDKSVRGKGRISKIMHRVLCVAQYPQFCRNLRERAIEWTWSTVFIASTDVLHLLFASDVDATVMASSFHRPRGRAIQHLQPVDGDLKLMVVDGEEGESRE